MNMKIKWEHSSRRVWLDGKEVTPAKSLKVVNHSPDGFNVAYGGSGPSQLALAILLEKFPKGYALANYQNFKWNHVSNWPARDFEIEVNL